MQPFLFWIEDYFLDFSLANRLLDEWPSFESGQYIGDNGLPGEKSVHSEVGDLGPAFRELERFLASPEFLAELSCRTGIPFLLFDPSWFGGGTHENRHGQSLDQHIDFNNHPRQNWRRRLNLILSLTKSWQAEWGGCLELHNSPCLPEDDYWLTVLPKFNRAVFFETSDYSWHGFKRINLPLAQRHMTRKTIACYFYQEHRYPHEHRTVYIKTTQQN
mgnify:CR=1 FL=1